MSVYRTVFDAAVTRLDAEKVHDATMGGLAALNASRVACGAVAAVRGSFDASISTELFGKRVSSPVGMAAGFDKNARAYNALAAFGFGFVEVGTITALPQPGNPAPRLFRLPADDAIINRMGFNNVGAHAAAEALGRAADSGAIDAVLGINIGKSKVTTAEDAADDYATSARLLAPYADYIVINVSSPNTPGLRDLQAVESLRPLVRATIDAAGESTGRSVPVMVKVSPDAADDDLLAIADMCSHEQCAGVIAINTSISRDGLRTDTETVHACGAGGLSGPVLQERSREVLRLLARATDDDFVLFSVGGITSAHEAYERIRAGAHAVQGYTGLIYGGPTWPRLLARGIAECLAADGFSAISQARGNTRSAG